MFCAVNTTRNNCVHHHSFIHLCCCRVIHEVTQSVTAAHVDKKIRRDMSHIFAFMVCCIDLKQLYDLLGSIINSFGDPNDRDAKKNFEKLLSLEFNVDEESTLMVINYKKIFGVAKKQ
jgi:hypothetical protein